MTDRSDAQTPILNSEDQTSARLPPSSQDLKYPQILLEASFHSLLSHSFASTATASMEAAPQTPCPPPSLSESWASISDAEYAHDEDLQSETTDAGSLIDVHSANDVQSITEDTPSEDGSSSGEYNVEEQLGGRLTRPSLQSSSLSRTPAASRYIGTSSQTDQIILDEPVFLPDHDHVLVKHTLTPFSESEATRLQLPTSSSEGYIGTLHIALSRSPLRQSTRNSFRLLLLGPDYTESLRTSLVNKVADALVAANDGHHAQGPPSRYHVVPDSFGPGSQPAAAEVIPVDRTLDVESFHSAILGGETNKNIILCNEHALRRILSTFDERQGKYVVTTPDWQHPHLAIILIDSKGSPEARLSACSMMIFAKRLKIPMVVVRMDNDWNADFAPLVFADTGAQVCIEKRPLSQDSVLRNLPLDLGTFLNLNPAQLGRHLAYLLQTRQHPLERDAQNVIDPKHLEQEHIVMKVKDVLIDFWGHVLKLGPRRILHMVAILAGTLMFLQWVMVVRTSLAARHPGPLPRIIETLNMTPSVQASTSSVPAVSSSSMTAIPLTLGSHVATGKKLEAETLGSSHIIIRTSDKTIIGQKSLVEVYRKENKVDTETKMLFPGVFSVRLDPSQAFRTMNVCFSPVTRSSKECVEVQFGQQSFASWVKELIDNGEDRLQQQLAILHGSLRDIKNSGRTRDTMKEAHKRLLELEQVAEQDLRSRWFALSAWQSSAMEQVNVFIDQVQKEMNMTYQKTRAGFSDAYWVSRKSAVGLLDRINMQKEVIRLRLQGQEQIQSERLATSQDRAQHIVQKVRERMRYRHR